MTKKEMLNVKNTGALSREFRFNLSISAIVSSVKIILVAINPPIPPIRTEKNVAMFLM